MEPMTILRTSRIYTFSYLDNVNSGPVEEHVANHGVRFRTLLIRYLSRVDSHLRISPGGFLLRYRTWV
jgi:hypothetical protein